MSSEAAEYSVLPITERDTDEVLEFLKRTFFVQEPVNVGVGLCQDGERCEELERYCRGSMLSGFSLRAAAAGGATVSALISGVLPIDKDDNGNDLYNQALSCKDPKFQRVLHVLAQREAAARISDRFPQHRSLLEVKVAATDPAWGRRGLMRELIGRTEQLARAHNITLMRMDTSSAYSARAADRCGFTCISRLLYRDIKLDGVVLTSPPPPHDEDRVNVKLLTHERQ